MLKYLFDLIFVFAIWTVNKYLLRALKVDKPINQYILFYFFPWSGQTVKKLKNTSKTEKLDFGVLANMTIYRKTDPYNLPWKSNMFYNILFLKTYYIFKKIVQTVFTGKHILWHAVKMDQNGIKWKSWL